MSSRPAAVPSIGDIITTRSTVTHFQPILSARRKSIVGLEALTRGAVDHGALISPKELFRMAAQSGLRMPLERACHEGAMRSFSRLSGRSSELVLFLNLSLPVMREHDATASLLREVVQASGTAPRQVALEILEGEIDDLVQLCELVASFRDAGFLLALDDVGAGHSNLDRIPLIKPDILKIDRSLIAGVERDYYKQETVKSLIGLSRTIGALVIAEGVETEHEAIVALELGADLLQGYFLAQPAAVQSAQADELMVAVDRIDAVAQKFRRHMVRKIHDRRLEHRRCHLVMTQIRDQLVKARVEDFDEILAGTIAEFPDVECVYVLNEDGIQVTETIAGPGAPRNSSGLLFQPMRRHADHSLQEYYYLLLGVELPQYTTEPYVSPVTGRIGRTNSTSFRDSGGERFVLCIEVIRN